MNRSQIAEIRQLLNQSRQNTLQLIRTIDEETAHKRPRPDAWNVKEHVAHLVAVEQAIVRFARRILYEDRPVSPLCYDETFNQDAWNNRQVNERASCSWAEAVETLAQTRANLLDLLGQIPEEALTRTGSHPIWGEPVTLASILRLPYRHERGHREEIAVLCAVTVSDKP